MFDDVALQKAQIKIKASMVSTAAQVEGLTVPELAADAVLFIVALDMQDAFIEFMRRQNP